MLSVSSAANRLVTATLATCALCQHRLVCVECDDWAAQVVQWPAVIAPLAAGCAPSWQDTLSDRLLLTTTKHSSQQLLQFENANSASRMCWNATLVNSNSNGTLKANATLWEGAGKQRPIMSLGSCRYICKVHPNWIGRWPKALLHLRGSIAIASEVASGASPAQSQAAN